MWAFQVKWHLAGGARGLSRCGEALDKPTRVLSQTPSNVGPVCKVCAGNSSAKVDGVWHACTKNPNVYVCGLEVSLPEHRQQRTLIGDKHCPGCFAFPSPQGNALRMAQWKEVEKLMERGFTREAATAMVLDRATRQLLKDWSPDLPQPVARGKRQR